MFKWGLLLSQEERIAKNVSNLINIRKMEVPYDRDLGITPDYIDKPIDEATSEVITDILDTIEQREPRAIVEFNEVGTLDRYLNYEVGVKVSV